MKNMKRLLSVLLCLAMVLAVMPMAFAADTTTVYCSAPSDWTTCHVYYWGSADGDSTWPGLSMTKGSDGLWYAEIPSDVTGLLFNKQGDDGKTADLTLPTNGDRQYNYAASSWSAYGEIVEVVEKYFVAGTSALCNGQNWSPNAAVNQMTKGADGLYTITYENVPAGTYEFKVTDGTWTHSWGKDGGDANYKLVTSETGNVTIKFNADTKAITVEAGKIEEIVVTYTKIYCDADWDICNVYYWGGDEPATWPGVEMTKDENGIWVAEIDASSKNIIFNNKVGEEGNQTEDLNMPTDDKIQFNVAANEWTTYGATITPEPEPEYDYYVAGQAGLCNGYEWNPAENKMTKGEDGIYTITFENIAAGTFEYKITTGSWETPSYGYGEGNYQVVTEAWLSNVTITFNAETKEANASVEVVVAEEPGAADIKWQVSADFTAESATTDLRLVTWVDSLDYASVTFTVTAGGVTKDLVCDKVYTAINAAGASLTAADIFGEEAAYLATHMITGIEASAFESDIEVYITWTDLDGNVTTSETRTFSII